MLRLTKQEQNVLLVVIILLLTGWAVKAYRTAHPPPAPNPQARGETGLFNHRSHAL